MLAVEGGVALIIRREVTAPVPALRIEQKSPVKPSAPQGI
jgi:hypothetical protein